MSRIIFDNGTIAVCVLDSIGLTVQNKKTGQGKALPKTHKQYGQWLEAFETAIDDNEIILLAKNLLN